MFSYGFAISFQLQKVGSNKTQLDEFEAAKIDCSIHTPFCPRSVSLNLRRWNVFDMSIYSINVQALVVYSITITRKLKFT